MIRRKGPLKKSWSHSHQFISEGNQNPGQELQICWPQVRLTESFHQGIPLETGPACPQMPPRRGMRPLDQENDIEVHVGNRGTFSELHKSTKIENISACLDFYFLITLCTHDSLAFAVMQIQCNLPQRTTCQRGRRQLAVCKYKNLIRSTLEGKYFGVHHRFFFLETLKPPVFSKPLHKGKSTLQTSEKPRRRRIDWTV